MQTEFKDLFKNLSFTTTIVAIGIMAICLLVTVVLEVYNHWEAYYLMIFPCLSYVYRYWQSFAFVVPILIVWLIIFCSRIPEKNHFSHAFGYSFALLSVLYASFIAFSYISVSSYYSKDIDQFYSAGFIWLFATCVLILFCLKGFFISMKLYRLNKK